MVITAALIAVIANPAAAADSVGYNHIAVPANTDVRFSLPFTQQVEAEYAVDLVTANGVTVTEALETDGYNGAYYVRFLSGDASGLWTTITDNGVNDITLEDANVLALVSEGDLFRVYKHHTLGSVFPAAMENVSHINGTQVLIFDNNIDAMDQNVPADKVALYNNGAWIGAGISNNTVLVPETQMILRNNAAQELKLITLGDTPDYTVSFLVAPDGDLNLGTGYPVPVVLNEAGLEGTLRQVLLYDNNATGQNKPASTVALYDGTAWVGAGVTGEELINESESFTLRLPASETGNKVTIVKPY